MEASKGTADGGENGDTVVLVNEEVTNPESSGSSTLATDDTVGLVSAMVPLPWFRRRLFWRKYILSLLLTLIFGGTFALVMDVILPQEGQWSDQISHKCEEYCENSHMCDHTMEERPAVQQPVNAYSNIAYIWCGLVPLIFLRVDLSTIMYFCSSAILAISSFMFHASISKLWMHMDGASMYTYGSVLIFHGLYCVFNISWKLLAVFQVALFIAMPILRPNMTVESELINSSQLMVVVALAAVLVLASLYKIVNLGIAMGKREQVPCCVTSSNIMWNSVKVVSIAFVPAILSGIATIVWMQDMTKDWCDPGSKMQWHGVWHCFTGFSSLWLWVFYDMNKLKDTLASSGRDNIHYENSRIAISKTSHSIGSTELFNPSDDEEDEFQNVLVSDPSSSSLIKTPSSMA